MIIATPKNSNLTFKAPPDWNDAEGSCGDLPVLVQRTINGLSFTSAWHPTPAEMAKLQAGAPILLEVIGSQPPVSLTVGDVP